MNRITKKFADLAREQKKALIPFITAGDPDLETTESLILELEKSGADIIELGVPFSDPSADGPVIQAASERALANKVNMDDVLKLVSRIRKKTQIPLLLMGYYNPMLQMGLQVLASKAAKAGVDAFLVVDLPPEESAELGAALKKENIALVHLLAPTSDEERIIKAAKSATGFIYYVSLTGVTGAKLNFNSAIGDQIQRIRTHTSLPIAVGFGISKPDDVRKVAPFADGVVVGSALVKLIAENSKNKNQLQKTVSKFISSLQKGLI